LCGLTSLATVQNKRLNILCVLLIFPGNGPCILPRDVIYPDQHSGVVVLFNASGGFLWGLKIGLRNSIALSRNAQTASFSWMSVAAYRELNSYPSFWRHWNPSPVGLAACWLFGHPHPEKVQINHFYFEAISITVSES
jgi:hypothetical protein